MRFPDYIFNVHGEGSSSHEEKDHYFVVANNGFREKIRSVTLILTKVTYRQYNLLILSSKNMVYQSQCLTDFLRIFFVVRLKPNYEEKTSHRR